MLVPVLFNTITFRTLFSVAVLLQVYNGKEQISWKISLQRKIFFFKRRNDKIINVEASEVERPWILKDSSVHMLSLGLLGPAERKWMCCHRSFVSLCSHREECTDLTNGKQEEARRGCPSVPLRWVSCWQECSQPQSPESHECTSLTFLAAGCWPILYGPFFSWEISPLLSWHTPF